MMFTISGATYGQSCVRLAKLSPDGVVERRSVLRCEARKSYFHKLWLVDGNDIYFGTQSKQGYAIEPVSIKD